MNKHLLLIIAVMLCWTATEAKAQWAIGIKGSWTCTSPDRSIAGRIDETYSRLSGFDAGFQARCEFNNWLALRADLSYMKRSHRMDRNLNYLDPVFTEYRNDYLMLPVVADFSFGGEALRGHLLCGGFAGYWLQSRIKGTTYWMTDYYTFFDDFNQKREFNSEDQRFTAGVVGGVGLNWDITDHVGLNLDALYYYDLVSYRKSYAHLSDPRYLSTLSIDLGVYYKF